MNEYDGEEPEFDDVPICAVCGCELEWVDCGYCYGDGLIDLHDEDPINFDPGDMSRCPECHGRGGWLECPNIPHERDEK